jgi:hypothetical protein
MSFWKQFGIGLIVCVFFDVVLPDDTGFVVWFGTSVLVSALLIQHLTKNKDKDQDK